MPVYFIRAEGSGLAKIGFAVEPWKRLSKIQSDCPWPVTMAGIEPGNVAREAELHQRFAAYRERGEWFREEGDLAEYLKGFETPERQRAGGHKKLKEVAEAAGCTVAHASRFVSGTSDPHPAVAVQIFRATGRKLGILTHALDEEAEVVARVVERSPQRRANGRKAA